MSPSIFFRCAMALMVGASAVHAQRPAALPASGLVQANFVAITDAQGFVWDVDSNGCISQGSNCFSSAFLLTVNSNQFSANQSLMTPDGREYVLIANLNGIEVTRRIRVDQKTALCRYIETFRNTTNAPQSLTIQLQTQLSQRVQSTVSDTGAPLTTALGAKDSGILALRAANVAANVPAVAWMIGTTNGKVRPTFRNESNYRLYAGYALTIPAGGSTSIVHVSAQRRLTGTNDAKSLAKLFAPLRSSKVIADMPAKDRKGLMNFRAESFVSGDVSLPSLLEKLGVERGATDVLAIGAETRLKGTASCTSMEVETRHGKTQIPLEKMAALIGGPRESRILLRDGQALSGKVTVTGLKFTLNTGTTMELNASAVDRLVMRASPQESVGAGGAWAFIETFEGDRLAVKADPALRLRANTAWGLREITTDELMGCAPAEESPLGFFVTLRDGSRFIALLDGEEITFDTVLFGRKSLPTSAVQKIAVIVSKEDENSGDRAVEGARLLMVGGQVLGGQIDLPELHFLSPAGVIPVPPNLLRTLHNNAENGEESSVFTAELWGGGSVSGALREVVLPVRSGGGVMQVPAREVVDVLVPSPMMPEGLRDKITALVRDLGNPDWQKREAASRELGELGAMARTQLEDAQKQTNDAEVRRRAQALLDAIQG